MLGAVTRAEELDLSVACVSERDLELAVFDELAAFDPVGRRNGDVQEGAGAQGFGAAHAAGDVTGRDCVLLWELETELVEDIARDLLFNVRQVNSFSTASSTRLLVSIIVSLEVTLCGFEGAAHGRDRAVHVGQARLLALGEGMVPGVGQDHRGERRTDALH